MWVWDIPLWKKSIYERMAKVNKTWSLEMNTEWIFKAMCMTEIGLTFKFRNLIFYLIFHFQIVSIPKICHSLSFFLSFLFFLSLNNFKWSKDDSPKLQHCWNLTIRYFSVISRTLVRGWSYPSAEVQSVHSTAQPTGQYSELNVKQFYFR